MLKILCSELGNPTLRQWIRDWGFDGIRLDVPLYCPPLAVENTIAKLAESRMRAVFIVGGWSRWEPRNDPDGRPVHDVREAPNVNDAAVQAATVAELAMKHGLSSYIEGGNEPDITAGYDDHPERLVESQARMLEAIATVNPIQPFITAGVSNMNANGGLRYLRKALDAGLVTGQHRGNVFTGVHPYRSHQEPWEPLDGADVRSVIQSIKREAGPVACTEIGWHTATQERKKGLFGLCREAFRFNDEDVLEFAKYELELWAWAGSPVFCWYQLNSGPHDEALHRFGLRPWNHQENRLENERTTIVVEAFRDWKAT